MMKIVYIDPLSDSLWQNLIETQASGVFHSREWLQILAETYDFAVQAAVVMNEEGTPLAGLPFCRLADIKSSRTVALPFSDYCDPIAGDTQQWKLIADVLLRNREPIMLRCLHNQLPLSDERFSCVGRAKWHGLSLQPDIDRLWNGLHRSARYGVRRARSDGVEVRIADRKEDLRAFFELHLSVRKRKYRLLAQPYRFFENIWQAFVEQQRGVLMTAVYQNTIIAAIMFLQWQDTLYYKFGASQPTALAHRPNEALLWEGVKYGKAQGCLHMDLGLSDWDQEGLIQYKRKFTGEEKTISFLQYQPNGACDQREQGFRALLPQLTDLFTDASVPDPITERAGDALYRFFC